jgi:hypothetical protein
VIGASFVKFATAAADGTAAGTVSFKMAPLGWLKPFTGPNLAAFQSADPTSTKMFFRVDDTGTMSCRLRGYETMTDVSTGTGLFPTDAQMVGGGYLNKSNEASVAPVKWRITGTGKCLYLNVVGYSSTAACEAGRTSFFGDFLAGRPGGDPYAFILGCATTGGYGDSGGVCDLTASLYNYCPRAYHGLGSSVGQGTFAETGGTVRSGGDPFFGAFPSAIDGGLQLSRRYVSEGLSLPVRGHLPGFFTVPQSGVGNYIAPGSRIPGTGPLSGRVLLAQGTGASADNYPSAALGISFVDITGPWG